MYHTYFNLKLSPFNITSDPDFFFESRSHREALATLSYGIKARKGILLVTGEVGTGKTTLCKKLLEKADSKVHTSIIFNPYFSETQLLKAIVEDFGLKVPKEGKLGIVKRLNSFLLEISKRGENAVVIIDEAQNLNNRQLEQVRLLSNLETSQDKLLQIILVGQPELEEKLSQFKLRQIRQRIFVKHGLAPLDVSEIKNYIEFRLKKAGNPDLKIVSESYDYIYKFSQGIPRLINLLCERALLYGFAKDVKTLNLDVFKACAVELSWHKD